MSDLTMDLVFEGSVRMGTGRPGHGLDEVIDDHAPLCVAGVKGVLRDEARLLLDSRGDARTEPPDHQFITTVFGGPGAQRCPWNFDITVDEPVPVTSRASLQLNDDGSLVDGALHVKEEAWITKATLRLFQRDQLGANGLPGEWKNDPHKVRDAHLALISVAARLADKVGQRRTRGMGWVMFAHDPSRSLETDVDIVEQIKEASHA